MSSVFNACSYPFSSRTSNAQTDRTEDAYLYHRHCTHSERARSRIFGHNAPKPPFLIGWDALMAKFFQPMPGSFTNNFFFEFDKGVCTVRHLANTHDSEAWSMNLCANLDEYREGELIELFGTTYIAAMVFDKLKLPTHQETICQSGRKQNCIHFKKKIQYSK